MATISAFRSAAFLLAMMILLGAGASAADPLRAPQPVAYYDVDRVVRDAEALGPETRQVAALEQRYDAEAAPLRAEVDELRTLLADRAVVDPQRRVLETQLAERTLALLILRTEGMREIARARTLAATGDVERRIAAVVARLARDEGYLVVIRTDRATRVLDRDAIDLTPRVIEALDRTAGTQETREPVPVPQEPRPSERRRTRTQSCGADAVACTPVDAGS